MEPFEITVELFGKRDNLLVIPELNEEAPHEYRVFNGDIFLGKVWPECNLNGIFWCTDALMANELLEEIGDKIENHES